jgi:hypothetical protein
MTPAEIAPVSNNTAGFDVTEAASHLACYDTAGIDITDGRWTRDA